MARTEGITTPMAHVIIGVDPHKRSATIEIVNHREKVLTTGRFDTSTDGYRQLRTFVSSYTHRVWAIEGCNGMGRYLAQRLVTDGETVLDVPAKLAAQARVLGTGQGRKTDPVDAHHIAVAGLRARTRLRQVAVDDQAIAVRLLADRRQDLGARRTELVNRLHALLVQLVPGGAKKKLTTRQARTLLADLQPAGPAGHVRHRLASELAEEITTIDARITAADKELTTLIPTTGSTLLTLYGLGPATTARLIGDIADITRFPTPGHFATWNGTAPRDASSGDSHHQRLNRGGNRQINRVIHIMATAQLRHDTPGRAYYQRKLAEGKTPNEAMRALKRRLSNIIYRQMLRDTKPTPQPTTSPPPQDGPGKSTPGATTNSSAAGPTPTTGTSEKPQPGPANNTLKHQPPTP